MQEKKKLAIEVDNVQKIYKLYDKPLRSDEGGFRLRKKTKHKLHYALKGVDMKIYQGETVGIIGTNGSGKSTIPEDHHRCIESHFGKSAGKWPYFRSAGAGCRIQYGI